MEEIDLKDRSEKIEYASYKFNREHKGIDGGEKIQSIFICYQLTYMSAFSLSRILS